MSGTVLQSALREMRALATSPRAWAGMAVAGIVLGLSGPFGTYDDFALAPRLAYWLTMVVLTYGVGYFVIAAVTTATRRVVPILALRVGLAGIAAGVPVTLTVIGTNIAIYGEQQGIAPLTLWGYCTAISIAVATAMVLFSPRAYGSGAAPETEAHAIAAPPPLLERLPHAQRGPLLSISVADHYVEVNTERGKALVLMRLSDAMKETAGVRGLQVHRSHWVARDAVKRVVRSDGRTLLELKDGTVLPVSRGYLPAVREAGLG